MASFRETAIPITCAGCGARVLAPQLRPGILLKCPKCGSLLRIVAAAGEKSVPPKPAAESQPLGSAPKSSMQPSDDAAIAAEIDELLFGDADQPTSEPAVSELSASEISTTESSELPLQPSPSNTKSAAPADEGPTYHIPPTELPHVELPSDTPAHVRIPSTEASHESAHESAPDLVPDAAAFSLQQPDEVEKFAEVDAWDDLDTSIDAADAYKLSESLGPLPIPDAALGNAPTAHPASGTPEYHAPEIDYRPKELPSLPVPARMQHVIDEAEEEVAKREAGDTKRRREVFEKFTPDATLADPHRAFLRGVFEFPFYYEVIPQWIKLAFSLGIEMTLTWWFLELLKSSKTGGTETLLGGGMAIGAVVLVAPAALLGFTWIAMTWAVASAIIEETAAGMNHIENWPESLVLDDLPSLVFPAAALLFSSLPGVAIKWMSESPVARFWFFGPSIVLLFPFLLISILETGTVFIPISKQVFRCVRRRPGTWLWFYGESTAIVGIAAWICVRLWFAGEWWRFSLAAILGSGALLIYFRLLGRLALVCANQAIEWSAQDEIDEAADDATETDGNTTDEQGENLVGANDASKRES